MHSLHLAIALPIHLSYLMKAVSQTKLIELIHIVYDFVHKYHHEVLSRKKVLLLSMEFTLLIDKTVTQRFPSR